MAHDPKNLQVEPTACTYGDGADKVLNTARNITPDNAAAVEAAGYFNASVKRLPVNTIIDCVVEAGGSRKLKTYIVTANNGTAVTIAAQTVA